MAWKLRWAVQRGYQASQKQKYKVLKDHGVTGGAGLDEAPMAYNIETVMAAQKELVDVIY
jgi:hypothetical protein